MIVGIQLVLVGNFRARVECGVASSITELATKTPRRYTQLIPIGLSGKPRCRHRPRLGKAQNHQFSAASLGAHIALIVAGLL